MIDARGLSCPMPVLMVQKAMKSKENYYEVMVDNKTPCENVTRFAQSQGYKVEVEEKNGEYLMKLSK
jgi:TusA-related sulfurtransferase